MTTQDKITEVLTERESKYGEFAEHARISQCIKTIFNDSPNWNGLPSEMRESLEMIAHKIARILNGDPLYKDSWTDIIGYATLIETEL